VFKSLKKKIAGANSPTAKCHPHSSDLSLDGRRILPSLSHSNQNETLIILTQIHTSIDPE
jgi:hypothetical protein